MERLSTEMGGEMRKGPWTSEEDLVLSSFVQENGPGNWTSIPIITGLNRCGKSCRLRWMNYVRPGIKRGNFTPEEDRKIVQLQAILGNKWASIAHYLPGRTANDIKNYWNSNLKEVDEPRSDNGQHNAGSSENTTTGVLDQDSNSDSSKRRWERMLQEDVHLARKALSDALSFSPQAAILDRDDLSLSPPAYAPNLDASLPLIAPGLSSPLPMAAPQLSSGCMSFKPPHGWNQNTSQQQLMVPTDKHQFRSQAAGQITWTSAPGLSSPLPMAAPLLSSGCMSFKPPCGWNQKTSHQQLMVPADDHQSRSQASSGLTRVSNCSTTTEPYVFNCKNVAIWLKRWNEETSKENKCADYPLPAAVAPPAFLEGQHEYDPPAAMANAFPSGQDEDDLPPELNMSVPYDHASWPFF